MFLSVTSPPVVLSMTASAPTMFWMVPPDPAVAPVPVTINWPDPVLVSVMAVLLPLCATLWNVTLLLPMVVLAILTAVPLVVVIVFVPVTFTVPLPVAVNAGLAPVESVSAPLKLIVVPVLLVSEMPVLLPVLLIAPVNVFVSPVLPDAETNCPPLLSLIVPLYVTVALFVLITKSVPVASVIELPAPAEKTEAVVPSLMPVSNTPVVELFALVRVANGRLMVAFVIATAGPALALIVPTPAAIVMRKPVPAPVLTAPEPVTSSPAPVLKMSRSVKSRSPVMPEVPAIRMPFPPTGFPDAPMAVVPAETVS